MTSVKNYGSFLWVSSTSNFVTYKNANTVLCKTFNLRLFLSDTFGLFVPSLFYFILFQVVHIRCCQNQNKQPSKTKHAIRKPPQVSVFNNGPISRPPEAPPSRSSAPEMGLVFASALCRLPVYAGNDDVAAGREKDSIHTNWCDLSGYNMLTTNDLILKFFDRKDLEGAMSYMQLTIG